MCLVLAGCASRVPPTVESPLRLVPPGDWPEFVDDLDQVRLDEAIEHSLSYFDALPEDTVFTFGLEERSAGELAVGIRRFQQLVRDEPDPRRLTRALKEEFILLRSVGRDGHGEVLYTGYYEPVIEARRDPEPPFEYPVYGIPDDLVTVDVEAFGLSKPQRTVVGRVEGRALVPYADRGEIDFGRSLRAPAPVLGYLSDPVDVRSIGKLLIDDGLVPREEMSMQAIRAYLAAHPEDLERVLAFNPSYVFFRPLKTVDGPLGCYGVPVTAGRSIATDRRLFPAPVIAWIEGTMPDLGGNQRQFSRFAVNQDTGGSIRGPGRVDLFIGAGDQAAEVAGRMNNPGRFYLLLPRST